MDSLHSKGLALWLRRRRHDRLQPRLQARRHCEQAARLAIPVRLVGALGQGQESEGAGSLAGGGGGLELKLGTVRIIPAGPVKTRKIRLGRQSKRPRKESAGRCTPNEIPLAHRTLHYRSLGLSFVLRTPWCEPAAEWLAARWV